MWFDLLESVSYVVERFAPTDFPPSIRGALVPQPRARDALWVANNFCSRAPTSTQKTAAIWVLFVAFDAHHGIVLHRDLHAT